MKNRLTFFRAQVAVFDGAADPRGAIDYMFCLTRSEAGSKRVRYNDCRG